MPYKFNPFTANLDKIKGREEFLLSKEPTGFVAENYSTLKGDISFGGTRTFTIQPQAGQTYFAFTHYGREFRKTTAVTKQITDVTGIHVIYFDANGDIQESVNPNVGVVGQVIRGFTIVAIIYWNATDQEAIYVGDERHTNQMDGNTHSYLHFTIGLAYLSGLGLTDINTDQSGDVDSHAQFGVESGRTADEDIDFSSDAITSTTGLPIYYMLGASAEWTKYTNAGFSVRTIDGTDDSRLCYNQYLSGSWKLTEVPNGDYVLCHVFATTEKDHPIIAIMGQNLYTTGTAAKAGALTEILSLITNDILFPEIRPIGTVIFQTGDGYDNAVKARIVDTTDNEDYVDWRSETVSRVAISSSNHGSLTGLADDDHPEYRSFTEELFYLNF
jgi:hypothetical protein